VRGFDDEGMPTVVDWSLRTGAGGATGFEYARIGVAAGVAEADAVEDGFVPNHVLRVGAVGVGGGAEGYSLPAETSFFVLSTRVQLELNEAVGLGGEFSPGTEETSILSFSFGAGEIRSGVESAESEPILGVVGRSPLVGRCNDARNGSTRPATTGVKEDFPEGVLTKLTGFAATMGL
jgi:hypothetical protein